MRNGYTLIELLLVVAIVAAIGSGVAVTYGREFVESSRRQMTLREMAEIKRAFLTFHNDNATAIAAGVTLPGTSTRLPTSDFCSTFKGSDKPTAGTAEKPNVVYGMLEFYERFGLWALLKPTIVRKNHHTENYFIRFSRTDTQENYGWHGPYLTAATVSCYLNSKNFLVAVSNSTDISSHEAFFPQIATQSASPEKTPDFYRVVYLEHCENEGNADEPIYRRLLLVASRTPGTLQTEKALEKYTGNRRKGTGYPLDSKTGVIETENTSEGLYFLELLNLDRSQQ